MSKKIILLICLVLISGCGNKVSSDISDSSSSSVKSSKKKSFMEISCTSFDSSFLLYLENGQVVKYVDSIDGDLGENPVNIINEEHLSGVSSNDEALSIMNLVMKELDGGCEKK